MNLLIAEDNPLILKALSHTFKGSEYNIHCAIDGLMAKEIFDREKPEVVITDLMMPFITGLELIEHIRECESSYTKIIILSLMSSEDVISQAFDLGIDDYVIKPFISSELIARTNRLLKYSVN